MSVLPKVLAITACAVASVALAACQPSASTAGGGGTHHTGGAGNAGNAGNAGDAAGSGTRWTMPDERGSDLQRAQDDIQRASGDPVFFSHSHDLLGTRMQILDADWQVCTQSVAPGTRAGQLAHVDFGVVKSYEQCP